MKGMVVSKFVSTYPRKSVADGPLPSPQPPLHEVARTWRQPCAKPLGAPVAESLSRGIRAEGLKSKEMACSSISNQDSHPAPVGLLWRAITRTERMCSECITGLIQVVRLHSNNWPSSQSYPIATPILACKLAWQLPQKSLPPPF